MKAEQVECGISATVILSYGKVYIVGKLGTTIYKTFTQIITHEEIRDVKIS